MMFYFVLGDNIHTASAIAKQCGILTPGGIALEGPVFRNMTPKELDEVRNGIEWSISIFSVLICLLLIYYS